ncbi:proline racemase family protein [Savagea sp. SN6]|uniref:Proline racemase family protein n=1 Tax=Savagea serpentis TaxID=2785297 RepID=A0A8J7KEC2_9BACL|nr:proline racemase family protein [Savagea serpentis]MBF4501026.1 proline racemase family protein [Savagea serpentis]
MIVSKVYRTVDTHVEGEIFRFLTDHPFRFQTQDVKEKQALINTTTSQAKLLLLNEPRGHRNIYAAFIESSKIADYQLITLPHEGVPAFKYEVLVASITYLYNFGLIEAKETVNVETAVGIFTLHLTFEAETLTFVTIKLLHEQFAAEEIGGRTYQFMELPENIPNLKLAHLSKITKWAYEQYKQQRFVAFDGTVLYEKIGDCKYRTVNIERDGTITRSPNVDVTALLAKKLCCTVKNETVFNSSMTAYFEGDYVRIPLKGFVTGTHEFLFDDEDPLKNGFII